MPSASKKPTSKYSYAFLGPVGTFTELALSQIKNSKGVKQVPVNHVAEAIELVLSKKVDRAVIPVENSIEGGVSATLDALAGTEKIRIYGEYLVPVTFNLVAKPGTRISGIKTIATHPVAYAQTRKWLPEKLPKHVHLPSTSTASAARDLLDYCQAIFIKIMAINYAELSDFRLTDYLKKVLKLRLINFFSWTPK